MKKKEINMTDAQLLLLNNLVYKEYLYEIEENSKKQKYICSEKKVSDIINKIPTNSQQEMSSGEWKEIIEEIKKDPELMALKISDIKYDKATGARMVCFYDEKANQPYAVFKGTGQFEWKDNVLGGCQEVTSQQRQALEWVESLPYNNIIVSGHSKGGNKAQFVAYLSEKVTKCVSFDGQGFSEEFINKYWAEIQMNKHKVTCYAAENDFVNILLNWIDLGERRTFVPGYKCGSFAQNHAPNTLLNIRDIDKYQDCDISPSMKLAHQFTVFVANEAPDNEKKRMLNFLAKVVQKGVGENKKNEAFKILFDKENVEELSSILAYLARFAVDKKLSDEDIKSMLITFGLDKDTSKKIVKIIKCVDITTNDGLSGKSSRMLIYSYSNLANLSVTLITDIINKTLTKASKIETSELSFEDIEVKEGEIRDFSYRKHGEIRSKIYDFYRDPFTYIDYSRQKHLLSNFFSNIDIYTRRINNFSSDVDEISRHKEKRIDNVFEAVERESSNYSETIGADLEELAKITKRIEELASNTTVNIVNTPSVNNVFFKLRYPDLFFNF